MDELLRRVLIHQKWIVQDSLETALIRLNVSGLLDEIGPYRREEARRQFDKMQRACAEILADLEAEWEGKEKEGDA